MVAHAIRSSGADPRAFAHRLHQNAFHPRSLPQRRRHRFCFRPISPPSERGSRRVAARARRAFCPRDRVARHGASGPERALLLQSPGTAGLILAAKAIARYPEFKSEHFAEYFLIGTLLSFSIAVLGGVVLARVVLGQFHLSG